MGTPTWPHTPAPGAPRLFSAVLKDDSTSIPSPAGAAHGALESGELRAARRFLAGIVALDSGSDAVRTALAALDEAGLAAAAHTTGP